MQFEHLANELVLHVFQSCSSVSDVLNLAATCRHFRKVFNTSQKLPILYQAAEAQFGPLQDAIQMVTHNASQPAHEMRTVPFSFTLLKQLFHIGSIAMKWEDIYPSKKWVTKFEERRLLTSLERYRVRRAIYRLWLYNRAFHNARYPRTSRTLRHIVLERAELLHNWSTTELAEMIDIQIIIRDMIGSHICPSNGTIQRQFRKRYPNSNQQLLFNIHLNYPSPTSAFKTHFHSVHQISSAKFCPADRNFKDLKYANTALHEPGAEGWGDDVGHYYVVEDMLKMDPGQILWLMENAPLKGMVEGYIKGLGEWFENNGDTFGQTFDWVLEERGEHVADLRAMVVEGEIGVAC